MPRSVPRVCRVCAACVPRMCRVGLTFAQFLTRCRSEPYAQLVDTCTQALRGLTFPRGGEARRRRCVLRSSSLSSVVRRRSSSVGVVVRRRRRRSVGRSVGRSPSSSVVVVVFGRRGRSSWSVVVVVVFVVVGVFVVVCWVWLVRCTRARKLCIHSNVLACFRLQCMEKIPHQFLGELLIVFVDICFPPRPPHLNIE